MSNQITPTNPRQLDPSPFSLDLVRSIVFHVSESENHENLHTLCEIRTVNHCWKFAVDTGMFETFWRTVTSHYIPKPVCSVEQTTGIDSLNPVCSVQQIKDIERTCSAFFLKGFHPDYDAIPDEDVPKLCWQVTHQDSTGRQIAEMRKDIRVTCGSFNDKIEAFPKNPFFKDILETPVLLKFACLATELQNPHLHLISSQNELFDTALELVWTSIIQTPPLNELQDLPTEAHEIRKWLNDPANAEVISSVEFLMIGDHHLVVFPPEISKFTGLKSLTIFNNKQLEALPDCIGNLTNLKTLQLSFNGLKTLPCSIGNLSNLVTLELDNNQLQTLPDTICKCDLLTKLSVRNNPLEALPVQIGNLKQLDWIMAQSTRLTTIPTSMQNSSAHIYIYNTPLHLFYCLCDILAHSDIDQAMQHWTSYPCQSYLASFCQSIHLQEDQSILESKFSQLPQKIQKLIRMMLGPDFQVNPWAAKRSQLMDAVSSAIRTYYTDFSDDNVKRIHFMVWDLAGRPPGDDWGKHHATENRIRLIDAFVLAAAVKQYGELPEDQKKLVHYHNWNLAEKPPGDNWGEVHLMDDKARFLKALSLATGEGI